MSSAMVTESAEDDAIRRQELIDAMEANFLHELAKAGANVPPRSTVTTALLRGLLWEKREDDLLTHGHTKIETQVVKSSRRSALVQLVSQIWNVPKPDYDRVDSILAATSHDSLRSSASIPTRMTSSPSPDMFEANALRTRTSVPSSLGSSAEYDAYEALSSLSDAMVVDEPSPIIHQPTAWTTDHLSRCSRDSKADAQKEPIDSITSVVFRSSPQLTSHKFTRSPPAAQDTTSGSPLFGSPSAAFTNRVSKVPRSNVSPTTGTLHKSHSSIATGKAPVQQGSPRSPVSSPSQASPGPGAPLMNSSDRIASEKMHAMDQSGSHSRFALPVDLKTLIRDPTSSGSPSSVSSDDSPLVENTIRPQPSRPFASSLRMSPAAPMTPYGWNTPPGNTALGNIEPSASPIPTLNQLYSPSPLPYSVDPRTLPIPPSKSAPAAFGAPQEMIPVWVPRLNPPAPLLLYPIRSAQGEWFYTYQPITFADMNVMLSPSGTGSLSPLGGSVALPH